MKTVPLSDWVEELESGSRPKGGIRDGNGDVPSLGAEHISNDGGFNFRTIKKIPATFYNEMSRGRIKHGDILIVKDGATTGKVSYVNGSFPFNDAAINEHVFRLAVKRKKADPAFVFRFLQSPSGQAGILADFRGATVGGIGRTFVDKVQVPEIGPKEQRRIAAILDKADAIRRKREQALALADDLLKSAFLEMFGGLASWKKPITIRELINAGVVIEVQDGNHGEIHPKAKDFSANGIPFVAANMIRTGRLLTDGAPHLSESWKSRLRIGFARPRDVLLSHKGSIGFTTIVGDETPFAILSPQVTYYRLNESKMLPEFLSGYFKTAKFQAVLDNFSKQSTRSYIGITRQKDLKVPLPPIDLQKKYAGIQKRHEALLIKSRQALVEAQRIYASLSQRAFRCEL